MRGCPLKVSEEWTRSGMESVMDPLIDGVFQLTAPSQATHGFVKLERIIQLTLKDGSTEAQ